MNQIQKATEEQVEDEPMGAQNSYDNRLDRSERINSMTRRSKNPSSDILSEVPRRGGLSDVPRGTDRDTESK